MDQTNSSTNTWYVVGAVIVIAALAFWYFSSPRTPSTSTETSSDTTTSAISAELNQIPDGSGTLEQDASASAAAVGSF